MHGSLLLGSRLFPRLDRHGCAEPGAFSERQGSPAIPGFFDLLYYCITSGGGCQLLIGSRAGVIAQDDIDCVSSSESPDQTMQVGG